jgi:hypothetical protein
LGGARVLAERRGEKYLVDVFSAGANTIHDVLYKAQALEPILRARAKSCCKNSVAPDAHNSRRIDIPKGDVDPNNRLEPGKKYFDLAKSEYQDLTPIFKLVKEVLPQK